MADMLPKLALYQAELRPGAAQVVGEPSVSSVAAQAESAGIPERTGNERQGAAGHHQDSPKVPVRSVLAPFHEAECHCVLCVGARVEAAVRFAELARLARKRRA